MRGKCFNCDQYGHRKAECPTIKCFRCKRLGHMASNCTGYSSSRSSSPEDLRGSLHLEEERKRREKEEKRRREEEEEEKNKKKREGKKKRKRKGSEGTLSKSRSTVNLYGRGRSAIRSRAPPPRSVSAECELQQKDTTLRQKERELQEKEKALQQQALEIEQKQIRMAWEEEERKKREQEEKRRREEEKEKRRKEEEEKRRKEEEEKKRKKREEKAKSASADTPNAYTYDAPSKPKAEEKSEPLHTETFELSTLEYRVIEKFYQPGELKELMSMSNERGTVKLQTSPHGSTEMEVTCDNVFLIWQRISDIKEAIRENSATWKLSSSSTFAQLPASQHAMVVNGTRVMGAKTLSTTVEDTLEFHHGFNAVMDVTVIPPSRDLNNMVTVTAGSITAVATVDVLVSVVGHDLSMRDTSVGQAILSSCGEQQAKELRRSVQAKVAQITECGHSAIRTKVPVGTKVPATSYILHAVLSTFQEGGHLEVKKIVTDCLTAAANEGLQKIAFPPLGVGRKFAYPVAAVARSMVSATLQFVRTPTSIKRVIFATNDKSVASDFNRELREQTAAMMEQPCPRGINFQFITGDVVAGIFVKDEEDMPRAKTGLSAILRGTFLSQVTVCDATEYHELAPAVAAVIQAAAADKCVRLQEERDNGGTMKLVALGTAENSRYIADLVKGKMYEDLRNKSRELSFVSPHSLPSYWQLNQNYGSIQEAMAGLEKQQKKYLAYKVDSTELREITNLMTRTWKHGVVGVGNDARNLGHTSIEIVRVCRLENPELWEKYSERREKLLRRLRKSHGRRLQSLEKIAGNSGPVLTTISAGSVLRREVISEINEHYLFHGTKKDCLLAIARDGLDFRFSQERPLLGRGVYAAESPTKADQYTDPSKEARTGGQKTMLLVRMLLGDPHINTDRNPPKFSRPPCKGCLQLLCNCQHATHYDSVVDDAGRLFREFIVYEQCQCYPEYIITYKRV